MPIGDNDWHALATEEILEPDLPICDPHHHLWDLRADRAPYDRYLLDQVNADAQGGHNVRSTVFVEARSMYRAGGPAELRSVGEVEFVQGIAAASASGVYGSTRIAAAIVGRADLKLGAAVEPVLDALQAASPNRFRGIRHIVALDPHPEINLGGMDPSLLGSYTSETFREGARVLARKGMTFDAWQYHHQLQELADFARAVPELTIVVNHVGGFIRIGPYVGHEDEVLATWRAGIAAVARFPNVVMKLGGLGMPRFGFDWHTRETPVGSEELASDMAPFLSYCIEQFGPERCMFESNFPVDKVSFSYNNVFNAFKRFSASYTPTERAAMFEGTATRIYNIIV